MEARGTRSGDDPKTAERIRQARREGRRYTIIWSAIVAGIVALFIGRAIEVQIYNDQRERSVKNCQSVQEDRRAFAKVYGDQADQTLGNPKKHIKPIDIDHSAFKNFKPLIISQAKTNRKLSDAFRARIENCEKVFPSRDIF